MTRVLRAAAPAAVTLFAVVGLLLSDRPAAQAVPGAALTVVVVVVLAWRQTSGWPLVAGLVVAGAGLLVVCHGEASNLGWFGYCVLVGWAATRARLPHTLVLTAVMLLVFVTEVVHEPDEPGWGAWSAGSLFAAAACTLGRRQADLLEQLGTAQAGLADRARVEERNRIAAEMHDVIGHALTVSLLHVGTARLAIEEGDTEEAMAALDLAESQSRRSLEEVRASVGVMRGAPGSTAPLPGAADLDELVASFRRAGTPVTCELRGDLAGVPAATGLAAYRIVQEALTNVARHAGGAGAGVRVDVEGGSARVVVASDGRPGRVTTGTGLLGMRERAESVGGRLTAGPADGGWRVEAELPT